MLSADQWRQDCFDAITAVHLRGKLELEEAGRLRLSIKKPVNQKHMDKDTWDRTGGACPT